ncbi:MAG: nitrogenase molybdenum-iron protein subunit beta [Chitinispirillaceae bacterium]|nr:nitrogenase molybdenum-iron protein subunit beta [Chitinispirillaceae bacterium]
MLLRHTTKEIKERDALRINPAKTCQPIGAMYAALGIHKCLPHSHGSQGCCAYHRSALTRHYKEPIMATTSSFTEGAAVFGGQANLLEAITNIFSIYNPDAIAIHTTCLSETIGDDISQICKKAIAENKVPKGKYLIMANTPSYVGSHVTGFANMVRGIVDSLCVSSGRRSSSINIIPGYIEPSDVEEIKRICNLIGIQAIVFPDTSKVLNSPQIGIYNMYPEGGAKIKDIIAAGDSKATIALGTFASGPGGKLLEKKCNVPLELLKLPIGIRATDEFIDKLRIICGIAIPPELEYERGQLLDAITDMQQYFYEKKAAIVGDPDHLIPLVEFLTDLGIKVRHVVTGTPSKKFEKKIKEICGDDVNVKECGDYFYLHQLLKNEKTDLIFGNTYAKYIARDEDIPLIRIGFPIYDRIGHQYWPIVGYKGALRIIEKILDTLLDRYDRDVPEEKFELVM